MMETQESLTLQDLSINRAEPDIPPNSKPTQSVTSLTERQLRLSDIVKTIPKECFQKNPWKAWLLALSNILVFAAGIYGIAVLPWYFLPILWVITGTAFAGFFTLAHDCGHYSFAQQRWVNELLGNLLTMPLLYPFHNWCLQHNSHHTRTNKLGRDRGMQLHDIYVGKVDPNWHPLRPEIYGNLPSNQRLLYRLLRGPLWWTATVLDWWNQSRLDLSKLSPKDRLKVKISLAFVLTFSGFFFPIMLLTTGLWGLIKFWFVPWLIYHFWFSTFTLIHHTAPDILWKVDAQWNEVEANLAGTVHCNYPWWVEFLSHDINYHIPHHISTAIPFYNLRKAHESLKQTWTPYIHECDFTWSRLQQIINHCHLYNSEQEPYLSLNEFEELNQSAVK